MGSGEPTGFIAEAEPQAAADMRLVAALRQGDEAAFLGLVEQYHGALQRVALSYVGSWALAEEVVQETWLGVIQGIGRFEGRASLKTWIFRILTNRARTRGAREARSIAFADLGGGWGGPEEPAVDPSLFLPKGHAGAGWWSSHPANWENIPKARLLAAETRALIDTTIAALPRTQRMVITLRDIENWSCDEVCRLLELSDANQRVLLHRARAKVRHALAQHLAES